jgi:NAD+ kinase
MVRIGLLFKPNLREFDEIIDLLIGIEREGNVCFTLLDNSVNNERLKDNFVRDNEVIDFILCFGGDGTMLKSVKSSLSYNAPVLGINFGKLGFLSDCSLHELNRIISSLLRGKYTLESRMLIDVLVFREDKLLMELIALNDVAIFKDSDTKLLSTGLYVNNQLVYESRSDGIVVSTPTGSTAYSLSAGGPIISPSMKAMIVTPLNPHILTVRPMVFAQNDKIEIRFPAVNTASLQVDGINALKLMKEDRILVKESKQIVSFVKLPQKTFYKILRKKLHLGKKLV